MGKPKPTHERRAPAMPDKATPKKPRKPKEFKPYGYSYVWRNWHGELSPRRAYRWFVKEAWRDQAFEHELAEKARYEEWAAEMEKHNPKFKSVGYRCTDLKKEQR